MDIKNICEALQLNGELEKYEVLKGGNINSTYKVYCKNGEKVNEYLLQRINKNVFKNPEGIMQNIINVTEYIASKVPEDRSDFVLHFNKCKDGNAFVIDETGDYWRSRQFLDCICFDNTNDLEIIEEAGHAFGEFQYLLNDYDASNLFESIKDFHNTKKRILNLENSIKYSVGSRKLNAKNEIQYLMDNKDKAEILCNLLENNEIPLRVTHNDTKCNNVVFNKLTKKALAVIDLDTIMPGLTGYDFGDGARSISCSCNEDEKDLSKVFFDLSKFNSFTKGYLSNLRTVLTETEKSTLAISVYIMTFELASRFLEDYLNGDIYFRIENSEHNLIRAKCQIALCKDIYKKMDKIKEIIYKNLQ